MNTIFNKLLNFTFLAVIFSTALSVSAQVRAYRVTDNQVKTVITRIETRTDTFRTQVDRIFDNNRNRNNRAELIQELTSFVSDFENSTDTLSNNFTSRRSSADDVQEVLNRAAYIDSFLRTNRVNTTAQTQWNLIKSDLNILAGYYRVSFNWEAVPTNPNYPTNNNNTPYSVTDNQVQVVINRVETGTDTFRQQIERIYGFRNNDRQLKDQIVSYVNDFETSTDNLKNRFTSRRSSSVEVQEVLNRAAFIENFMRNNRGAARAQSQWNLVRADLDTLAGYYRVSWNWNNIPTNPTTPTYPGNTNNPRGFDARLTGTYRLNTAQSDVVSTVIDKALSNNTYNANQGDRIRRNLERRLTSPDSLVIQKTGQQIMMASSNSPQVTFNADGVSRSETNQNGRTVQIGATATNSELTISYEGDRMNDFNVSFMPMNNGQLRVTRRLYLENQNETVTVTSVYDKTDQNARWDGITYQNNTSNNIPNSNVSNDFIIANNTRLVATLDTPLSTKTFRDGDRFSMTVTSPNQYQGAVIEGRVNGSKSGVVSGRANLAFDFDTIRLRNGSSYRFAGIVDQVREPDGDIVGVNNEGTVRDGNQTTKTATRAGIGAALGAIIGAIAGGGSGAAIGAGVGAGAGAGSVILQGRDNLELPTGTEFSLTSTAPANR